MKKRYTFLIFICICNIALSNTFKNIENFTAHVKEEKKLNNKTKIKEYELKIKFPELVYKKMTYPEINKGEIYFYEGDRKTIYYPLLKQTIEKKIDNEENQILNVLKDLQESDKEGEIEHLEYTDGTKIVFSDYKKINKVGFPMKIKVFEDQNLILKLNFSEVVINNELTRDDMIIDKGH